MPYVQARSRPRLFFAPYVMEHVSYEVDVAYICYGSADMHTIDREISAVAESCGGHFVGNLDGPFGCLAFRKRRENTFMFGSWEGAKRFLFLELPKQRRHKLVAAYINNGEAMHKLDMRFEKQLYLDEESISGL